MPGQDRQRPEPGKKRATSSRILLNWCKIEDSQNCHLELDQLLHVCDAKTWDDSADVPARRVDEIPRPHSTSSLTSGARL